MPFRDFYLRPYVDFDVSYVNVPGYVEQGSSGGELQIYGSDQTTFIVTPSVEWGTRYVTEAGTVLRPYMTAGVSFSSSDSWTSTAALLGVPGASNTFQTVSYMPSTLANFDIGIQALLTNGGSSSSITPQSRQQLHLPGRHGAICGPLLMSVAETAVPAMGASAPQTTDLSCSRGFANWLAQHGVSLAFSSYQTGSFSSSAACRAVRSRSTSGISSGPWACGGSGPAFPRVHGAGLAAGECAWSAGTRQRAFRPAFRPPHRAHHRRCGRHEVAVEANGRVVFVNTKHSCLATFSLSHSFKPLWKPKFVSRLAAEDRCHLNGLALDEGRVRYVTAVSETDVVDGWRPHRTGGGVLIRVDDDAVIARGFSMPHSLGCMRVPSMCSISGRGYLVRVDPATGSTQDVAFCPGFMRGLAFHANHAIVTLSLPRNMNFKGLPIEDEIARRGGEAWCGCRSSISPPVTWWNGSGWTGPFANCSTWWPCPV